MKLSQEVDARTLQLVEALARQFGILPPLPSEAPPVPTTTTTIGTSSRDYSTITAWEADLDNGAVYTSGHDAVGECYNDSAFQGENATVTITGGGTIGLNSVTLSVASGERHDGTAGTGARIVEDSGLSGYLISMQNASIATTVEWLEIDCNLTTPTTGGTGGGIEIITSGAGGTQTVRNTIIHDTGRGTGVRRGIFLNNMQTSQVIQIFDNIIYDIGRDSGTGSAEVDGIHSAVTDISGKTLYILNNTIHNTTSPGSDATKGIDISADGSGNNVKNNIVTDTANSGSGSAADFDTFTTTTNVSNNLSSDASAPGSSPQASKSSSNQFVSTTGGSEDLHLKAGADAIDNGTDLGTTPSGVEIDIDGRDRDANADTWDIGADEYVAAGGGAANNYYIMQQS